METQAPDIILGPAHIMDSQTFQSNIQILHSQRYFEKWSARREYGNKCSVLDQSSLISSGGRSVCGQATVGHAKGDQNRNKTWFMYYRTFENSYRVKLAPAGDKPLPFSSTLQVCFPYKASSVHMDVLRQWFLFLEVSPRRIEKRGIKRG